MDIVFLHDAAPGEAVAVRSASGEWPAFWRGRDHVRAGDTCQVELDIDEVESWVDAREAGEFAGVKTVHCAVVVCGAASPSDDGAVIVLNLDPGTVMVKTDLSPPVRVGQRLCLRPTEIQIFPTGV